MEQVIDNVVFSDFDEEGNTVSVTATSKGNTNTFHVQTTDGEYRSSLGCWILTDESNGDIDADDYPEFDFDEIVKEAEKLAETAAKGEENPNYFNKDASPYTRRFIDNDSE